MMSMQTQQASGRASALRVNHIWLAIFKTRFQSCPIAVRAAVKTLLHSKGKRPRFGDNNTSSRHQQFRILSPDRMSLRFTHHCPLKTDDPPCRCGLRFPYGTCRRNSTGLLEQMP